MQVILNEESVITGIVLVGGSPNGLEVSDIPQEVMDNPSAWKYINCEYIPNENYVEEPEVERQPPPTTEDRLAILESLALEREYRESLKELQEATL